MRILPDVDVELVAPALWMFLGAIATSHRAAAGQGLVVTSLRRADDSRPSRHNPPPGEAVTAADFRRWYLDARGLSEDFCRRLQVDFGGDLLVVLEPEWLTPQEIEARGGLRNVQPHVHVQLREAGWPKSL